MVVSFDVDNTREAIKELESKDYSVIPAPGGEKTRPFRNCEFAFIHPKKVNNVLLELSDYKWDEFEREIGESCFAGCPKEANVSTGQHRFNCKAYIFSLITLWRFRTRRPARRS